MTRDKFWEIVTTKLVWADYWNGQEEPSDEVKEILTNSILIPKPKFKKGDRVFNKTDFDPYYGPEPFTINSTFYNIEEGTYYYTSIPADHIVAEYDLNYYTEEEEEGK